VRTDTGLEANGEVDSSPEPTEAVIDAPISPNIASVLRELLFGDDPLQAERLWDKMYKDTFYFGRRMLEIREKFQVGFTRRSFKWAFLRRFPPEFRRNVAGAM